MIESVRFKNFKALRDTTLPLGRFTLIVGPNGSGKSTAFQGLQALVDPDRVEFDTVVSAGASQQANVGVVVEVTLKNGGQEQPRLSITWRRQGGAHSKYARVGTLESLPAALTPIRVFSLNAGLIALPVELRPAIELDDDGRGLAGVLDRLRDHAPERFEVLNDELGRWLPEFDRILFETPQSNARAFLLRTREGQHPIPARELSQGTLLSLAMLTLAYLPEPPPVVCLEEPDRGIHPRLLREVRDALYRLSHPEDHGEERRATQVIATTHSPVMLDLYRDHPEEIVIANKVGQEVKFERLSDQPNLDEILGDGHLGEIWYTGVLGGVPLES